MVITLSNINLLFKASLGGVNKSPACAMAFLMRYKELSFDEACLIVESKRKCTNLDKDFQTQLLLYEDKLIVEKMEKNFVCCG